MPKIGKRILKSSFAVFLCFVIYLLRNEQGIVFYSCIAAVLCVQQSTSNTIKVARNRVEGTLIGGFMGMLVLWFEKAYIPHDLILIQYALIAIMIVFVIYITVLLKKTTASYISCVVFMSVTVSHGMDVNPFMFAIDRIIDTLIGIFVALIMNGIRIPFHRNKQTLFYVDMNDFQMDSYKKIKLNHMIEDGAFIGFICNDVPGRFTSKLDGITVTLPILCFQGIAKYDIQTHTFSSVKTMNANSFSNIYEYVLAKHLEPFIYTIQYHMVHIYFTSLQLEENRRYVEEQRKQPYDHYICATLPAMLEPFALMIYVTLEQAKQLKHDMEQAFKEITCSIVQHDKEMVECYIYSKNDILTDIANIARHQHMKHVCLFQKAQIQHTNHSIQVYDCDHILANIHKRFYTFKQ